jgi:hypothetical protein
LIVSNHADLDLDEEDERTDLPASPQDADLEDGGGDLDDMARPKSTPSIAPTWLATPACSKRARAPPLGPRHRCAGRRRRPSARPAEKEPHPPPPLNLTRGSAAAPFPWSVPTRHVAFADRPDVIRFDALDDIVSEAARPDHDNETLLVPGAPEANPTLPPIRPSSPSSRP